MKRTTARWTTMTLAAAALMTLPGASFAQQTPPDQPPAQTQPQTQPPAQPAAPPAGQQSPQVGSSTQEAAKVHLTAARNSLSQLTQLPSAAQLQGEARTQISQLITNFNELITTQAEWKTSYAKVQANLAALLAPAAPAPAPTGTAGAVGTSGAADIDPAIRAKLMEFRNHLERFEDVAMATGGTANAEPASPAAATTAAPATATPPAAAQPTTPPDPEPASAAEPQELLIYIDAIEVILAAQSGAAPSGTPIGAARSTTSSGITLTAEQVDQLRDHLAQLRSLINKR